MESVNISEPQVGLNHNNKQVTANGNSRLRRASSDSGTGSTDNDEECLLKREVLKTGSDRSPIETELCQDENPDGLQNTSLSRNVACNGIDQEIISDESSSSNFLGSSSGLQQLVERIPQQDPVGIPLRHNHNNHLLQTLPLTPSPCDNGRSGEHHGNLGIHSAATTESPAEGIKSHENASENNRDINVSDINISDAHSALEENDSCSIQRLAHQVHPSASSSVLQDKLCEDSETPVASVGRHHGSFPRCLSVPSSSAEMPYHLPEHTSLPVSPVDLVPKHVMDSLGRELNRQRYQVKILQAENYQLRLKVSEQAGILKRSAIQYNDYITRYNQQYNEKDKALSTVQAELDALRESYRTLECQASNLRTRCTILSEEETKNKQLQENLTETLYKERARYNRDEIGLKQKIDGLEKKNQWLREELAENSNSSVSVTPYPSRDFNVSMRANNDTQSHVTQSNVTQSHQTQVKEVYAENTVCQTQAALQKQTPKKSSGYKAQQTRDTIPKMESTTASGQEKSANEICRFCYKKVSEFKSYAEFKEHTAKCGQ